MTRKTALFTLLFIIFGLTHSYAYVDPVENPYPSALMQETPSAQYKYHDIGNIWLTVTNFGFFGNAGQWSMYGESFPSCEFPGGSKADYLFLGALWVGSVVQTSDTILDTLVSVGVDGWRYELEFWPTSADSDTIYEKSSIASSQYYDSTALSEQEFYMAYSDDYVENISPTQHKPMGIRIEQTDYSWSYAYNRDIVFIVFDVENTSNIKLSSLYFGLYIDGDVGPRGSNYGYHKFYDDITGFRQWRDNSDKRWGSNYYDPEGNSIAGRYKTDDPSALINLAWIADFDGDKEPDPGLPDHPLHANWPVSADGATGIRILHPIPENISYNWWFSHWEQAFDWGPTVYSDPFDVSGTPIGDVNKYRILSNGYIDPDQVGSRGVNNTPGYHYPSGIDSINDARFLLSFGPYEINPLDTLKLVIAYIGGENFVVQYGDYDYTDIALNASWAYRIFDNPGIDTPLPGDTVGDGYKGEFVIYDTTGGSLDDGDTVWVTGDGVPDFVGPPPPPIPSIQVIPANQRITLLWDNASEYYKNIFLSTLKEVPSGLDTNYFEGYRVYRSETGAPGEWTFLREFDRMDFTDSTNSVPIAWNNGMPKDTLINGKKYYKYVDRGVLNYSPIFYSITAFDKGWPINEGTILPILESSLQGNKVTAYPSPRSDETTGEVIVIPNPYRASQTQKYIDLKWEDKEGYGWSVGKRRICFANLPGKCTLKIFSLAGDLINTIEHDFAKSNRGYEDWNLISRDLSTVVSGIYLFSVEKHPGGEIQVGKFVIIK